MYGHLRKDCRSLKPEDKRGKNAALMVEPANGGGANVMVIVNETQVLARVDTGSTYSLMTRKTFYQIGVARWVKHRMPLKGLSSHATYTLGYSVVQVKIDNDTYVLKCFIVDDDLMPFDMVLGENFLELTELTITGGVLHVKKLQTDVPASIMMIQLDTSEVDIHGFRVRGFRVIIFTAMTVRLFFNLLFFLVAFTIAWDATFWISTNFKKLYRGMW